MNQEKINSISNTLKKTRLRRSFLVCKTFELKFDMSHISNKKLETLNLLFTEAKWLYNHILALSKTENFNIFKFNPLIKKVDTLDFERNKVERDLTVIGSQIKQAVFNRLLDSIKGLSELKKKGHKVGKLKFKSYLKSVPLKQFEVTYRFNPENKNQVKIQNIKGYLRINGWKQIPAEAEFANATLVKKNKNFYLMVTVFVPKTVTEFKKESIGIDFGIRSTITLSTGDKIKINLPERNRTKKLRRDLSRKQGSKKKSKKSNSYFKNLQLVNKSIDVTNNQKKDVRQKITSAITSNCKIVCVQDESIKAWKDGNFGKQVHNSVLGGIMRDLKLKSHTLKLVEKYFPTTQLCRKCLKLNKIGLEETEYSCDCEYNWERDHHSALTVEDCGLGRIGFNENREIVFLGGHKELKTRVERCTSSLNIFKNIESKYISMKPEANEL